MLDGKRVSDAIRHEVARDVETYFLQHGRKPGLAVVLVGDDAASQIYVRNKRKACEAAHMVSVEHRMPSTVTTDEVVRVVQQLNADPSIHGILVQLPLPSHIETSRVIAEIAPTKDVDGLTSVNLGRLVAGQSGLRPCTPSGVIDLLDRSHIPIAGRRAVVVGRSQLVGLPLALMLTARNATVTIIHSKTPNPEVVCRESDIVVVAVGRAGLLTPKWIKEGAVVVDVGINRVDGKIVGDVSSEVAQVAGFVSPVPGGVGPMTIAELIRNTWQAFLGIEAT